MRGEVRSAGALLFLAFAGILMAEIWRGPNALLTWPGALYSDLLTAHLPVSRFIHEAVGAYGAFPLWNPVILGGQPLLGDPLAGLTYPPHWLTYLFPQLSTFNLLLWGHLAWAGWGTFQLARESGLSQAGATVAGLGFAGTPRLLGQWGLGHVTLTYAVCWTPWLMLVARRALQTRPVERGWRRFALAGGIFGGIMAVDPRWAPAAGLAAAIAGLSTLADGRSGRRGFRGGWLAGGAVGMVAAALTSAVLILPLLEFTSRSTRASLTAAEAAVLSLPPATLLQIPLPQGGTWPEWTVAIGSAIFLLALLGLAGRQRRRWWWLGLAVCGWLLSLGAATPVYGLLRGAVPGMGLIRVPARFAFLGALGASLLAGEGLEALATDEVSQGWVRRLRLAAFAGAVLIVSTALGMALLLGPRAWANPTFVFWPATVAILFMGAAFAALSPEFSTDRWTLILVGIVAVDLIVLGWTGVERREAPLQPPPPTLQEQKQAGERARTFSPSYSVTQRQAAFWGLELADGIHPLQLASYWEWMSAAAGFDPNEYSVTLPPFPQGEPKLPRRLSLDLNRLGLLNVEVIVSDFPLPLEDDVAGRREGELWLYANQAARPRAWVQAGVDLDPAGRWQPARVLTWSPNRISVAAEGPGVLVLSENDFPGWRVTVDGARSDSEAAGGLLRAVRIGPGVHEVEFTYLPRLALLGAALTALGWLLIGGLWWRRL